MSNLISLENVTLAYGLDPLLDNASLHISEKERVCLIGRNGTGKSSLLKIIEGTINPDSGKVYRAPYLNLARLSQELPINITTSIYDFVAEGLQGIGQLLSQYHDLTLQITASSSPQLLKKLQQIQQDLDINNGWALKQKIETVLTQLDLPADKPVAELSGGWQRKAALARALVSSPNLLLLDEPTNHLDIEAIQWLEDTLLNTQIAIIFVTHDRSLLQRLATRIIELDRGKLTSWPGDYQNFIRRKEEMLHAEAKQNSDFDKKLAQEEQWIRQGIKARRTRNEGRVRALEAMRLERAKRRDLQGKVSFNVNPGQQSGNLVIEAENITHGFEDSVTIKNFSTRIMRGDRIGLIGPNGIGKSTLLNILLGKLMPQQGKVIHGTKLQVAYFDQMRHALDLEKNVADNVVQGSDFIEINNRKQHIISYLNDFLFTPERARTPVKALSGGERSRLFLAKLFSQPANLLVMDEPTNDLDVETLELLEELLSNFQGTLLLVSHDRTFLDNVVTGTLVFEGEGCITEFVGGYQDWLRQKPPISKTLKPEASKKVIDKPKSNKKLSYKDERELEGLPAYIEKLEAEQNTLQIKISAPDFYQQDSKIITETLEKLTGLSSELEKAYLRWEELEQAKR